MDREPARKKTNNLSAGLTGETVDGPPAGPARETADSSSTGPAGKMAQTPPASHSYMPPRMGGREPGTGQPQWRDALPPKRDQAGPGQLEWQSVPPPQWDREGPGEPDQWEVPAWDGAWRKTPVRFTIPYPPDKRRKAAFCRRFGLNAYYAGKHWAQRRRDAEELHALTLACLKQAGIPAGPMPWPLAVSFWWDDGLDLDNHGAIGKAVVDALKGVLLQDDNRRWVRCIKHQFWDGGRILVELSPWEEKEDG